MAVIKKFRIKSFKKINSVIEFENISLAYGNRLILDNINFKIVVKKPIHFDNDISIKSITDELNLVLEKMIIYKPEQWIWSHNRWK